MRIQSIYNIAEICAQKHITDIVLSPGSRCAPLTIGFARHPKLKVKTISDERSAAFIAIGLSQISQKTSVLCCTSGSAAFNYAPGVAEAYYQQIPLLVITADRPPEWIDQMDGQTIRQPEIFGRHVKKSFSLPVPDDLEDSSWYFERIFSEAINLSQEYPSGPIHVNLPIREPLYPEGEIAYDTKVKIISPLSGYHELHSSVWERLFKEMAACTNVLIAPGQLGFDKKLQTTLGEIATNCNVTIVADLLSNLHEVETAITTHDLILQNEGNAQKKLAPELLITFGKSIISKNLKLFLRNNSGIKHWHIQQAGTVADTYKKLEKTIAVSPGHFFFKLKNHLKDFNWPKRTAYWKIENDRVSEKSKVFFEEQNTFSELICINKILRALPQGCLLHLANSMTVRYVSYLGLPAGRDIEVFSNRGTSGIDGVISTAYGAAMNTEKLVVVITGDMAFFYDRNAFWNNYLPSNLRIIMLNNHGGGIFRIIDGPNRQPELEEYFETKQELKAANFSKDYDLDYSFAADWDQFNLYLPDFFNINGKSKILEIETASKTNQDIFYQFKKCVQ